MDSMKTQNVRMETVYHKFWQNFEKTQYTFLFNRLLRSITELGDLVMLSKYPQTLGFCFLLVNLD